MSQREHGFTLIELMIVVAIIGILATLATSAYQTYTIRAQVSEGINFAAAAKALVVDAFTTTGVPPKGRVEAGMTPDPTDSSGTYVSQVNIIDGRIEIQFGGNAHADIQGDKLSLTPYVTSGSSVAWRCGYAPAPGGTPMSGGGESAIHVDPTVDERYLPAACR